MATAETDAERRARMDRRMDESLGDFDAMIRKERERLARERDANARDSASGAGNGDASGDGPGSGPEGTGPSGDMQSSAESGDVARPPSEGDMQSQRGSTSGGGSSNAKSLPTPPNVPSGDDDDIIARQIREAAEKETDPELREKLWQEYIEYKRNAKK